MPHINLSLNIFRSQRCVSETSVSFITNKLHSVTYKGKGHPITGHEGPEGEQMYSFTLPSPSALDGGGWSPPRPRRFTPGKDPVYRREGGPQGRSVGVGKISPPPGFDHRTFQALASRYTD